MFGEQLRELTQDVSELIRGCGKKRKYRRKIGPDRTGWLGGGLKHSEKTIKYPNIRFDKRPPENLQGIYFVASAEIFARAAVPEFAKKSGIFAIKIEEHLDTWLANALPVGVSNEIRREMRNMFI